ncbi:precorrin-6A/cobalt-precorrin-6A reductase [Stomatohabitans albus]|uniref:precorrin-6A/cobalt-precorrin-6A reductase n=1 Tax=Stomatohabitans albus TaxID=3110766 RepID=UPI00300C9C4D
MGVPARPHVLILGGSTQARHLTEALADQVAITLSLAGTTLHSQTELAPSVTVRRGGFGGVHGLISFLRTYQVRAVIDATHPYAATMHANVAAASQDAQIPHLRLDRPAWTPPPDATWIEVDGGEEAVAHVRAHHWQRVFVTTGRTYLEPWMGLGQAITVVLRSIDPADTTGIDRVETITQRGPFKYEDELAILERCDALVTRNAGGDDAKIRAAVATQTPILVWRRPPPPPGPLVMSVHAAVTWLHNVLGQEELLKGTR